eukprot:5048-Heterococcus_DN1.PRE.1
MSLSGTTAVLQHRLTTEVTHLPMFSSASSNPLQAASIVPFWGYAQIVALCGVIEFVQSRVRARPGYQAGDYIGSTDLIDEDDKDWYSFRTKELNNCLQSSSALSGFCTDLRAGASCVCSWCLTVLCSCAAYASAEHCYCGVVASQLYSTRCSLWLDCVSLGTTTIFSSATSTSACVSAITATAAHVLGCSVVSYRLAASIVGAAALAAAAGAATAAVQPRVVLQEALLFAGATAVGAAAPAAAAAAAR